MKKFNPLKTNWLKNLTALHRHYLQKKKSLQSDALIPDEPTTNTPLSHRDKCINHLLDEVSFLRKQIKFKEQQKNSLLEHASRCDKIYLSKKGLLLTVNVRETNIEQKPDQ